MGLGDVENSFRSQTRRAKSYKNITYYTSGLSQQHKNQPQHYGEGGKKAAVKFTSDGHSTALVSVDITSTAMDYG